MIGAAAGTPQYSGNYIPQYFSDLLLIALYDVTCLTEIANSNWEGEIKNKGDKVMIRTLPSVTIRNRVKNQKLVIENPDNPSVDLSIDYEKYYAFIIDRVDEYQSDIDLGTKWAEHAGKLMLAEIEVDVFADIYADADSDNCGATAGAKTGIFNLGATGSPAIITKANVYDKTVDCNTVLSEQKAPSANRWMVIPEAMGGMFAKSDLKDRNIFGDGSPIAKNGWLGRTKVTNMDIFQVSTLTSVTDGSYTCFHVLFGQREALTFASQFNETDSMKAVEYRGTVMRGFNDYGYEVVLPEVLGDLYATFVNDGE